MHDLNDPGRTTRRRRRRRRRPARGPAGRGPHALAPLAVLLVLFLHVSVGARAARADACESCPQPGREHLEADPNFVLEDRGAFVDYYRVEPGACVVHLDRVGAPRKLRSWLVLRAVGEVWNCPQVSACDTVTATVAKDDVRGWTLTGSVTVSGNVLGVGLSATLTSSVNESVRLSEVTSLSKRLCANWCHRIFYMAWFEVADYRVNVDFTVKRRYAWFTRNTLTFEKVYRKGHVWMDCGSGSAELEARSPIAGYWRLVARGCDDPACAAVPPQDLGWWPPPKRPLPLVPELPLPEDYRLPPPKEEPEAKDPGEGGLVGPTSPADDRVPPEDPAPPGEEPPEAEGGEPPPSSDLGDAPTGPLPDPMAESVGEPRP